MSQAFIPLRGLERHLFGPLEYNEHDQPIEGAVDDEGSKVWCDGMNGQVVFDRAEICSVMDVFKTSERKSRSAGEGQPHFLVFIFHVMIPILIGQRHSRDVESISGVVAVSSNL